MMCDLSRKTNALRDIGAAAPVSARHHNMLHCRHNSGSLSGGRSRLGPPRRKIMNYGWSARQEAAL